MECFSRYNKPLIIPNKFKLNKLLKTFIKYKYYITQMKCASYKCLYATLPSAASFPTLNELKK